MFGNLLNIAASVVPQQEVQWLRFVSRVQDERGRWINTFAQPEPIRGSLQPVSATTIKELGFDTAKVYAGLHTSHDLHDVQRGAAPDQVTYAGAVYEVMGEPGDWFAQDGWKHIYLVKVAAL